MNNDGRGEIHLLLKGEGATLYTIKFEGETLSEFGKFIEKFRDNIEVDRDFAALVQVIYNITMHGVYERLFRPEGKMSDNVCALPLSSSRLRLYCIRLSDRILILGNGGIKDKRTYDECPELCGYVKDLQAFDKVLRQAVRDKLITIEETEIKGIDGRLFEL